ncbi:MAG: adenylosuccinate synthase [Anaplasmataceae bacterium]|nr:adenylosuccinate synthase [Anaplasmataceae bacterium]
MKEKNVIVAGMQWGDEGKGKIVDYIASKFDAVIRFQGGNNAGHTVYKNDKCYKLSIIPSGVLTTNTINVIGAGCVLDIVHLNNEIEELTKNGAVISPDNLLISSKCNIILSIHKNLDCIHEELRGIDDKIGTTCKGIGPCYEDKVARRGLKLYDLYGETASLKKKIDILLMHHNIIMKGLEKPLYKVEDIISELSIISSLLPYIKDNDKIAEILSNRSMIFEGSQGVMLDNDHGTYPFVTSSNTLPNGIFTNIPDLLSSDDIKNDYMKLGVIKAYTTRVGSGLLPTEETGILGNYLQKQGNEFGTVSGRKRRCGWFDAVSAQYAIKIGKFSHIALTKMDILDGLDKVKICIGYKDKCDDITINDASETIPIYEELDGWGATHHAKSLDQLDNNAKNYIKRIEVLLGIPVVLISTGQENNDIIDLI